MSETSTAPETAPIDPAVEAALVASREARIESLLELARIPSVSALHEHAGDMVATAEWIADRLRGLGATEVEVIATDLHPIVYGRIHEAPGAPTVIVYCHYDVQPVDPLDLWEHPPFEPFVRDGRFIGRGVADDKGQLVMHLSALEALRAVGRAPARQPDLRVRGRGGVRLGEPRGVDPRAPRPPRGRRRRHQRHRLLRGQPAGDHRRPPRASCTRRSTSSCRRSTSIPACTAATVHNPANALATIVAALKGPDGRIRIPGFYDDVVALTDAEREALAGLPFDDEAFRAAIPVPALVGEAGWTTLERRGARPTLDVNGMWSGFQGEGAKTIIPAHAHAKISARLVADQRPEQIFEALRDHVAVARAGRRHRDHGAPLTGGSRA